MFPVLNTRASQNDILLRMHILAAFLSLKWAASFEDEMDLSTISSIALKIWQYFVKKEKK